MTAGRGEAREGSCEYRQGATISGTHAEEPESFQSCLSPDKQGSAAGGGRGLRNQLLHPLRAPRPQCRPGPWLDAPCPGAAVGPGWPPPPRTRTRTRPRGQGASPPGPRHPDGAVTAWGGGPRARARPAPPRPAASARAAPPTAARGAGSRSPGRGRVPARPRVSPRAEPGGNVPCAVHGSFLPGSARAARFPRPRTRSPRPATCSGQGPPPRAARRGAARAGPTSSGAAPRPARPRLGHAWARSPRTARKQPGKGLCSGLGPAPRSPSSKGAGSAPLGSSLAPEGRGRGRGAGPGPGPCPREPAGRQGAWPGESPGPAHRHGWGCRVPPWRGDTRSTP